MATLLADVVALATLDPAGTCLAAGRPISLLRYNLLVRDYLSCVSLACAVALQDQAVEAAAADLAQR